MNSFISLEGVAIWRQGMQQEFAPTTAVEEEEKEKDMFLLDWRHCLMYVYSKVVSSYISIDIFILSLIHNHYNIITEDRGSRGRGMGW